MLSYDNVAFICIFHFESFSVLDPEDLLIVIMTHIVDTILSKDTTYDTSSIIPLSI